MPRAKPRTERSERTENDGTVRAMTTASLRRALRATQSAVGPDAAETAILRREIERREVMAADLTTAEAAAILDVQVETVAALCRRPRRGTGEPSLRAYYDERLKRWLIPRSEVIRYQDANTGPGRPHKFDGLDAKLADRSAS